MMRVALVLAFVASSCGSSSAPEASEARARPAPAGPRFPDLAPCRAGDPRFTAETPQIHVQELSGPHVAIGNRVGRLIDAGEEHFDDMPSRLVDALRQYAAEYGTDTVIVAANRAADPRIRRAIRSAGIPDDRVCALLREEDGPPAPPRATPDRRLFIDGR